MNNPKQKYIIDVFGREPATLDDLGDCIRALIDHSGTRCAGLQWTLRYTERVSNYHNAPISGITNFSQRRDRPVGYPGWYGRIWVRYAEPPPNFGSDPLQKTLTYTGTGGYGSYNGPWERIAKIHYDERVLHKGVKYPEPAIYSWDYRIFAADWPAISMWSELAQTKDIPHRYHWVDPEVWRLDQEYMQECTSVRV